VLGALALCLAAFAPVAQAQAQPAPDRQRWQQLTPAERDRLRAERGSRERGGEQDRRAMSPDERQQLRRDIGDHGRDVYGGKSGVGPGGNHPAFAPGGRQQR
jgi:hypothetical protein